MRNYSTVVFEREGRENLEAVVKLVADGLIQHNVSVAIAFTSDGDGAMLLKTATSNVEIIAVTFPHEMRAHSGDEQVFVGMPSVSRRAELQTVGIKIIQGTMPFGILGDADPDWFKTITSVLGSFGGGMQLCFQAVLMACDAGAINAGERCVAFSADTAIVVRAGHSHQFFRPNNIFAVEHIVCKPLYYQISRGKRELEIAKYYSPETAAVLEGTTEINVTPEGPSDIRGRD